jgi:hypothetical protein
MPEIEVPSLNQYEPTPSPSDHKEIPVKMSIEFLLSAGIFPKKSKGFWRSFSN